MFDASFWIAIAFIAFIGVLIKFAYGKIAATLDTRAEGIRDEIEEAKCLREEAKELLTNYQRKHQDAVKEAEEIIAQAKADAKRMSEQAAKDLELEVTRRTELAQAKIARAEAQVIEDVRNLAVDIAVRAAEQLVEDHLDDKQADKIIDDAISELGRKVH